MKNEKVDFYYTDDAESQLYFPRRKLRIKVIEHFPEKGKTLTELTEELILYKARKMFDSNDSDL